ncbi:hypothetical protein [Amycolatopsis sp. NPDC051372]|uniref:hypothetical protein n=1 Tax=unclassified Amycolatopsis TaxID=2618356 RepID=UPI003424A9A8
MPRNAGAVEIVHIPVPEDVDLPPLPTQADSWVGHYQRVLLNVRTGEMSFFCADWRMYVPVLGDGDRSVWKSQYPGESPINSMNAATRPIPELLMFFIDTWTRVDFPAAGRPSTPAWVYLTREQGDAFVASLVPPAQQLVDNLFRVPGTDDLEWSAESVAAVRLIDAACSRYHQGPRGVETSLEGMINCADAVAAVPGLVRGEWAEMQDTELDDAADVLSRSRYHLDSQLREELGRPCEEGSGIGLKVYGARAWLYAYRAHEADNRPILDAARWFAEPAHTLIGRMTADHDDEAVSVFAERERTAALRDGIKLVGAEAVAHAYRDELRSRLIDDELTQAREAVERLQRAKAARAALLAQIISWGDARYHSDNDAELGRRAGMTRQAVNHLRKALSDDVDNGD